MPLYKKEIDDAIKSFAECEHTCKLHDGGKTLESKSKCMLRQGICV